MKEPPLPDFTDYFRQGKTFTYGQIQACELSRVCWFYLQGQSSGGLHIQLGDVKSASTRLQVFSMANAAGVCSDIKALLKYKVMKAAGDHLNSFPHVAWLKRLYSLKVQLVHVFLVVVALIPEYVTAVGAPMKPRNVAHAPVEQQWSQNLEHWLTCHCIFFVT